MTSPPPLRTLSYTPFPLMHRYIPSSLVIYPLPPLYSLSDIPPSLRILAYTLPPNAPSHTLHHPPSPSYTLSHTLKHPL